MKDSDIDYSDIPATNGEFWKDATLHLTPVKVPVSLRLDQDVLEWYKNETPRGYQTFINAVLRDYMLKKQNESGTQT
jgi:uncharacterized protein (DUF4415 family)